jgi:hypothetical protein
MPLQSDVSPAFERWLAELQLWAISSGATTWLIDLEPYVSCRVVGIVERLRIDPLSGYIEATVFDGTAAAPARWAIRRSTEELAAVPGRGVVLEGMAVIGHDGELLLDEPSLRTIHFPYGA